MADASGVKLSRCLNSSKKVRVIGKIRGFTDKESVTQDSKPWITVTKQEENGSCEKCTVFFENPSSSRKDGYELDYCYGRNDDIGNIYARDIKPLISAVFDGQNASVVALGARGSGKTFTIQGSQEKPGLALMAMSEILSKAGELEKSVSVSLYELVQDQAYDLLNPRRPVIQVLEDAQGKVNLRGISRVMVTSTSEFQNIYSSQGGTQNARKMLIDEPCNHRGLMVYISSKDDVAKTNIINKINFVDLAGYQDPRKNNQDGIKPSDSNRANKSLYALLNVVSAINANVIRVPYRESKLTRILQDSLGGTSHVLLLTCLNPLFCQDSVSLLNLVARSCRSAKEVLIDSTNRILGSAKSKVHSSVVKSGKTMSASLNMKKQVSCGQIHSAKNVKGRKLFNEEKPSNTKQLRCESQKSSGQGMQTDSNMHLVVVPFSLNKDPQDESISEGTATPVEDVILDGALSQSMPELQSALQPSLLSDESARMIKPDGCLPDNVHHEDVIPDIDAVPYNNPNNVNTSPPLSERIREISNNLKSLLTSNPLVIEVPDKEMQSCNSEVGNRNDVVEPKTPSFEPNNIYTPRATFSNMNYTPRATHSNMNCTPQATFSNRSSRMKDSLVQDYLKFLNSANKEELKSIKGIGEKRATRILQLRDESPEHFKNLDDLQDIGLSSNQVKSMMKHVAGELFN